MLWRVFCVYCPQKHRIPCSPPVLSVAPVLSPEAVERLTTGYSAHHDHHEHVPEHFHAYKDIHDHHAQEVALARQKHNQQQHSQGEAYLHHDVFLATNDADLVELEILRAHKHAANHPELGVVFHHELSHKEQPEVTHHHDESLHLPPHQQEVQKNKEALKRDLHLHHDVFLSTQDDDVAAVTILQHHKHAPNHPEEAVLVLEDLEVQPVKIYLPLPPSQQPHYKQQHPHGHNDSHSNSRVPDQHKDRMQHGDSDSNHQSSAGAAVTRLPPHSPESGKTPAKSPRPADTEGEEEEEQEAADSQKPSRSVSPAPVTPLYGLFTLVEEGTDAAGHNDAGGTGGTPSPNKKRPNESASANDKSSDTDGGSVVKESGAKDALSSNRSRHIDLNASPVAATHPEFPHSPSTYMPQQQQQQQQQRSQVPLTEAQQQHLVATARFRKRLLDLDNLWCLFHDFNVVPHLFRYHSCETCSFLLFLLFFFS
jgi:hypothetical protein